jgi:hypothetical protein
MSNRQTLAADLDVGANSQLRCSAAIALRSVGEGVEARAVAEDPDLIRGE